jgi:beta-galactosidase
MCSIRLRRFATGRSICWPPHGTLLSLGILLALGTVALAADPSSPRKVVSLDGTWQVEQGRMESAPKDFAHTVVVPGLLDMAKPAFAEVGKKSKLREAFWYRRTFTVDGPVPAVAILKIHKAQWGTKIFLNGQLLGEHLPCFTPALLDVKPHLKGDGQTNEIVIRVGANRESLPDGVPNGWDFEKYLFIPGIYDDVELILTAAPYVANIQTVPDVPGKSVRVVAELQAGKEACDTVAEIDVCETASGKAVGSAKAPAVKLAAGQLSKIDVTIPIADCRLWSPEDPFLYTVTVGTGVDALKARCGIRSFRCDPQTGRFILNGKPYYLRGTNVTAYRFFEDANRGDLPWRPEWVRKLHQQYKSMHWNSIRYCIGFPPDFWYDIADEEGFLLQDEFPIWLGAKTDNAPDHPKAEHIARQYTEWMRERWNHPCAAIWDAQNESFSPEIGKAIAAVRGLDLSNRPWENGYEGAPTPTDCCESHPYLFSRWCQLWNKGQKFYLKDLATTSPKPWLTAEQQKRMPAPIIINEYCWLWLNRDGSTTCLTGDVYKGVLGPNSTAEQRRMFHARGVAALTEFWRSHREAAGVLHFCGLGYARPGDKPRPEGGATCDDFLDLQTLKFEPLFEQYVRDAFNPVGIMIDAWAEKYPPGPREFPVAIINDLYDAWKGDVRVQLLRDGQPIAEKTQPCVVPALGRERLKFSIDIPATPARYQVEAALVGAGSQPVRSLRDFEVPTVKGP